jgi:hypothetical protein
MTLLDQLPRLSAYDPGALGEGGLDPLGLGAIADRIADILAPGVRARMSQPRFVTLSAVGALAYQSLRDVVAADNRTTVDITFEWLVVEALVRHPGIGRTDGLPGNQKARRALKMNDRLSARTYLAGPRVFGFTGVYRPFSQDSGVLTQDELPGDHAELLVHAWENDLGLEGYTFGIAGTPGGRFRTEIADACKRSLEKAECAAAPAGQLMRDVAERLGPGDARRRERRVLRQFITAGEHDIRNDLAAQLVKDPPASGTPQRALATALLAKTGQPTRRALRAAIDYENAATALDNAFRRFLVHAAQQHHAVIGPIDALQTPRLTTVAPHIGDRVQRAIGSIAQLDDALAHDTAESLKLFMSNLSSEAFLYALIERHYEVQERKGKLPWIDEVGDEWAVRTPYRDVAGDLDDEVWSHPMRLSTLATFLRATE